MLRNSIQIVLTVYLIALALTKDPRRAFVDVATILGIIYGIDFGMSAVWPMDNWVVTTHGTTAGPGSGPTIPPHSEHCAGKDPGIS